MRRTRAFRGFAIAAALTARRRRPRSTRRDRLARCQNNRDMLARLEAVHRRYATEEQIARARTAWASIRALEAEYGRNQLRIEELRTLTTVIEARRDMPQAGDERQTDLYAELVALLPRNRAVDTRIIAVAAEVNFHCPSDQPACILTLSQQIATGMDGAVAQQPLYRQFLQQVALHNANLVALRCDQPGSTATADISGAWRGYNNYAYTVQQNGGSITWSVGELQETATGTIEGNRVTATWRNPRWTNSGSGTVERDAGGRAVRIRWDNGVVFTR